jgi:hypothetical protein
MTFASGHTPLGLLRDSTASANVEVVQFWVHDSESFYIDLATVGGMYISVANLRSYQQNVNEFGYRSKTSMVLVRGRTTPTERPPLVWEVIANFCG